MLLLGSELLGVMQVYLKDTGWIGSDGECSLVYLGISWYGLDFRFAKVLDVDRQWPRCLAADEDQLLMISPRRLDDKTCICDWL